MSFGKSNNTSSKDSILCKACTKRDTDANNFKFAGKWNKRKSFTLIIDYTNQDKNRRSCFVIQILLVSSFSLQPLMTTQYSRYLWWKFLDNLLCSLIHTSVRAKSRLRDTITQTWNYHVCVIFRKHGDFIHFKYSEFQKKLRKKFCSKTNLKWIFGMYTLWVARTKREHLCQIFFSVSKTCPKWSITQTWYIPGVP